MLLAKAAAGIRRVRRKRLFARSNSNVCNVAKKYGRTGNNRRRMRIHFCNPVKRACVAVNGYHAGAVMNSA